MVIWSGEAEGHLVEMHQNIEFTYLGLVLCYHDWFVSICGEKCRNGKFISDWPGIV
jgi:hypothetical protein